MLIIFPFKKIKGEIFSPFARVNKMKDADIK